MEHAEYCHCLPCRCRRGAAADRAHERLMAAQDNRGGHDCLEHQPVDGICGVCHERIQ